MSTPLEHLATIEKEIHTMNTHGHLEEFELSVCVNAIEQYFLFEVRRKIEDGRQYNRDSDTESPGG